MITNRWYTFKHVIEVNVDKDISNKLTRTLLRKTDSLYELVNKEVSASTGIHNIVRIISRLKNSCKNNDYMYRVIFLTVSRHIKKQFGGWIKTMHPNIIDSVTKRIVQDISFCMWEDVHLRIY